MNVSDERGRQQARDHAAPSSLFVTAACFLVVWVLLGGAAPTNVLVFLLLAMSGSAMLVMCIVHGRGASLRSLSISARLLLLFFCLMPVLQLIPLPPVVWQALPGRELATQVSAAVGIAGEWRPLTLSVDPTFRTALVFLWLTAFVLSLLGLSTAQWHRLFGILLVLGLLNVAIGYIQVISSNPDLQLYPRAFFPYMNGLFANKNHTGLFIVLTFLSGYAWLYAMKGWDRRRLALVVSVSTLMIVALFVTFSRAAVVLGILALAFLVLLSTSNNKGKIGGRTRVAALGGLVAITVLLAALSSTDLVSRAISRFGGIGEDERWLFTQWSWPLVHAFFPFGAGIGSFTAVFPPHEQLAWVKPTYVNHVHDDYIEQLIEVGVAAPVSWALALTALVGPVRRAWKERSRPAGRLGLIGAAMLFLIAAHSLVDYPLRRPGIAVTFAMAIAAVLRMDDRMYRDRTKQVAASYAVKSGSAR